MGRKVVIGEVYYRDGGGNLKILRDQDFVIRNTPADPLGPYVDITDVDGTATTLDFYGNPYGSAYGYAVRRVKGASVAVRVLWNPSFFSITSDSATNMQAPPSRI